MIQRKQTIFLVLAAAMMALLFSKPMSFIGISPMSSSEVLSGMLSDGVFDVGDHNILLTLVSMTIALPLIIIFLFKNRVLQIRLSWITLTLIIATLIFSVIFFLQELQSLQADPKLSFKFGYLLPVLAILFLILSIRFIRKDEKLVRSADRLR